MKESQCQSGTAQEEQTGKQTDGETDDTVGAHSANDEKGQLASAHSIVFLSV